MRLSQDTSLEEVRQALFTEATAVWGSEELGSLTPMIEIMSNTLWILSQEPLDMMDEEPDFLDDMVSGSEES